MRRSPLANACSNIIWASAGRAKVPKPAAVPRPAARRRRRVDDCGGAVMISPFPLMSWTGWRRGDEHDVTPRAIDNYEGKARRRAQEEGSLCSTLAKTIAPAVAPQP